MVNYNNLSLNLDRTSRKSHQNLNFQNRQFLEKIVAAIAPFVARMTAGTEPKIWSSVSPSGEVEWNVYDPFDGRSASGLTETQVRSWLEERYNR
ncbi:MAG: hypothetical protein ACP5D7_25785 [Limnospira sp.]